MKKTRFIIILTAILLATVLLTGCVAVIEPIYTVWTNSEPYMSYMIETGNILNNGRYTKSEISGLSNIGTTQNSDGMHLWTKKQISDWLSSKGLSNAQATVEASWFSIVDHGILVVRSGSLVYSIRK